MALALPSDRIRPQTLDLRHTLGGLQNGSRDPTARITRQQAWWATRTPEGSGTLHLWWDDGVLRHESWGDGGGWLSAQVPALIGVDDEPGAIPAGDDVVARALAEAPGLRIGASHSLFHSLVPTVLAQRVTSGEAIRAWYQLCRRLSEPAPGPPGLLLPPDPAALAGLPYWWFHRLGVERHRADTIVRCARRAGTIEAMTSLAPTEAGRRLATLPGVGPWTIGSVLGPVFGDPDAVPVGDYHIPHAVCFALTGRARGSDEQMLELLAPYEGQRGRVIRALLLAGWHAPKFGPRQRVLPIARW
jgi:3-methyladenine DNA glycosylase/8-oxoguanine DNA glycosylase